MRLNQKMRCLRKSIVTAASMLAVSGPTSANDGPTRCRGDRSMCETVMAGERELTSMMTSGDIGPVARLFADDAVWSLGDGTRRTKSEAITALRKAPRMTSSQLLQAIVQQFGTVAIVSWKERWRASAAGRDEITFGTDTWMLRAGRWQIIASQEAHTPTK